MSKSQSWTWQLETVTAVGCCLKSRLPLPVLWEFNMQRQSFLVHTICRSSGLEFKHHSRTAGRLSTTAILQDWEYANWRFSSKRKYVTGVSDWGAVQNLVWCWTCLLLLAQNPVLFRDTGISSPWLTVMLLLLIGTQTPRRAQVSASILLPQGDFSSSLLKLGKDPQFHVYYTLNSPRYNPYSYLLWLFLIYSSIQED